LVGLPVIIGLHSVAKRLLDMVVLFKVGGGCCCCCIARWPKS